MTRVFVYGYDTHNHVVAQTEVVFKDAIKYNEFVEIDIPCDNALSIIQDAAITAGIKTEITRTLVMFKGD